MKIRWFLASQRFSSPSLDSPWRTEIIGVHRPDNFDWEILPPWVKTWWLRINFLFEDRHLSLENRALRYAPIVIPDGGL